MIQIHYLLLLVIVTLLPVAGLNAQTPTDTSFIRIDSTAHRVSDSSDLHRDSAAVIREAIATPDPPLTRDAPAAVGIDSAAVLTSDDPSAVTGRNRVFISSGLAWLANRDEAGSPLLYERVGFPMVLG